MAPPLSKDALVSDRGACGATGEGCNVERSRGEAKRTAEESKYASKGEGGVRQTKSELTDKNNPCYINYCIKAIVSSMGSAMTM